MHQSPIAEEHLATTPVEEDTIHEEYPEWQVQFQMPNLGVSKANFRTFIKESWLTTVLC